MKSYFGFFCCNKGIPGAFHGYFAAKDTAAQLGISMGNIVFNTVKLKNYLSHESAQQSAFIGDIDVKYVQCL